MGDIDCALQADDRWAADAKGLTVTLSLTQLCSFLAGNHVHELRVAVRRRLPPQQAIMCCVWQYCVVVDDIAAWRRDQIVHHERGTGTEKESCSPVATYSIL